MASCSCSSWSERLSNWSIGCGEEEEDVEEEEEEGERRDTLKEGKFVPGFCSAQQREVAILVDIRLKNSLSGVRAKH